MKHSVETINDQKSNKRGAVGIIETTLRKFKNLAFLGALLPIVLLYIVCLGVAFWPGSIIFSAAVGFTQDYGIIGKSFVYAFSGAAALISFILVLILIVPVVNLPVRPFVKPFRGAWFSLESIPWFYHNALIYLVRYTILNLLTPSPLSVFFFRAMGMKIGKNVLLNTGNISDACLIEIEDYATVGGSVYMIAHYGMKGFLVVDSLKIGKGANIGLHSYVMAAEVGEYATVMPNSVVLPKTKIPPHAKFGHNDSVISIKEAHEKKEA